MSEPLTNIRADPSVIRIQAQKGGALLKVTRRDGVDRGPAGAPGRKAEARRRRRPPLADSPPPSGTQTSQDPAAGPPSSSVSSSSLDRRYLGLWARCCRGQRRQRRPFGDQGSSPGPPPPWVAATGARAGSAAASCGLTPLAGAPVVRMRRRSFGGSSRALRGGKRRQFGRVRPPLRRSVTRRIVGAIPREARGRLRGGE